MVRWWLVPVYAVDRSGRPVLDLQAEDLEVRLGGRAVSPLSLIRKPFQPADRQAAAAFPVQAAAQRKMVFLVFDAAFSPYHLLARARTIAETVIAQSDGTSQYMLLSIEPGTGLKYLAGPTPDRDVVSRSLKRFIAGKKQDYLLESANSEPNEPQNIVPPGDILNPSSGQGARTGVGFGMRDMAAFNRDVLNRAEALDRKRLVSSYTSSLLTLNLVLGQFREFSKVVYLYSSGVTEEVPLGRPGPALPGVGGASSRPGYPSVDSAVQDSLAMIGRRLGTSGAVLFLVNPSGTGGDGRARASGERSLRILAGESGGRYFEGAEKEISRQVNGLEGGYYEISFRDGPEPEGEVLDLEVRCRRTEVEVLTVRQVGRKNEFSAMTDLEKEVLVLNILDKGPFARAYPNVRFVPADDVVADGGWLVCRMPLPSELVHSEWTVFKVARNFKTGAVVIEKESAAPASAMIRTRMKWRGDDYQHDLVFANARTGTILVLD